jgi:hypothetical protein
MGHDAQPRFAFRGPIRSAIGVETDEARYRIDDVIFLSQQH